MISLLVVVTWQLSSFVCRLLSLWEIQDSEVRRGGKGREKRREEEERGGGREKRREGEEEKGRGGRRERRERRGKGKGTERSYHF